MSYSVKNMLTKLSWLLIAIAVVYAVIIQSVFPRYIVDDAYISFRYAENLALNGELNWNVGENPVEGYTGVAYHVLLAGFIKTGISPVSASRFVGIVSFWLGFLMLYLIARRLLLPPIFVSGLVLLYATTPVLFTHTFSGMETMLFVSLMLASLFAVVCKRDGLLSLALLLTSLVRPEGVAFSAVLFSAVGIERYREGQGIFKSFFKHFLFIYFLPAAAYFAWRFSYYGLLLPNTFYAKSGLGFHVPTLVDIARFIRRYFAVPFLGLLLLFGVETDSLLTMLRERIRERTAVIFAVAGVLFSVVLGFVLANSHLIANFGHRLYVPFLPFAWLLLAFGWKFGFVSLKETREAKPVRYKFILSAFLLLVLYQSLFQAVKIREEIEFARKQVILHEDVHNAIGKELGRLLLPTETIIVYMDAGAIPYFSKLRTIDFGDLNDELLASHTLSPEGRIDYFFSQKVAAAVMTSADKEKMQNEEEESHIINDPRFKDYVLYKRFIPSDNAIVYYEFVYLRKDIYDRLTKEGKIEGLKKQVF